MEALERSNKNFEEWFVYQDCSAVSIPVQDNNNNNMASGSETLVNLVPENQNDNVCTQQAENEVQDATVIEQNVAGQGNEDQQQMEASEVQNEEVSEPIASRKSSRIKKPAIPDDYQLYLIEETDLGDEGDPLTVAQAMQSVNNAKWKLAMEDELKSMSQNNVWILVDKPCDFKPIGCKWVFKTERCRRQNREAQSKVSG